MRPAILAFTALLAAACVPADGAYYEPVPQYSGYSTYPGYATYPGYPTHGGAVYYAARDSYWERCRARYTESYCRAQVRDDGDRDRRDRRDRDRDRGGGRDRDRDRDGDRDRERRRDAERQAEAERARREQARQEQSRQEQSRRESANREQNRQERRRDPGVTRDGWENSAAGDHARSEFNRLSGKGE